MANLRVLHVTNNFPTARFPIYGIFVKEQIDSLTNHGIDNTIYFINGREKGKFEYLYSIFKIKKLIRKNSFNIIHCHHALSAVFLLLVRIISKEKVVVSFQNDPVHELGKLSYNFISKRVDAMIFKNNSAFIERTNSFYVSNGVNTEIFKPNDKAEACERLGLDPNYKYILFVSSNMIRKQKRYDRFCEVLDILRSEYQLNVKEIKLINEERQYIPDYLNAADIHLLTSDFEGSPNSVKECMACNTSVVSTNVGNVKELLTDVDGSFVSKGTTPNELAALVDAALKFSGEKNGRKMLIKQKLDKDSVAKKIIDIYNKLVI